MSELGHYLAYFSWTNLLADAGRLVGRTDRAPPRSFAQVQALLAERRRSYFSQPEAEEEEDDSTSEDG